MTKPSTVAGLLLAALAIAGSVVPADPRPRSESPTPLPQLEPSEVIRVQLAALRHNGPADEGIAIAYRFASPDNRRVTGPLSRFATRVRSEPYGRLLNHLDARLGRLDVEGEFARQLVTVVDRRGAQTEYLWLLSRHDTPDCRGCWLIDAVIAGTPEPGLLVEGPNATRAAAHAAA